MIEEIHFGGIYLPTALVTAVLAAVLVYFLDTPIRRMSFYRLLWQPTLFDLAAFILLWWGLSAGMDLTSHFRFAP